MSAWEAAAGNAEDDGTGAGETARPAIDWDAVGDEAASMLSDYIRMRSVNPPGDERMAAGFLMDRLRERGFEPKSLAASPERPNVIARLPGDGSKRPILLYSHMDVVDADSARWSRDPFNGEVGDGFVWGRGAIDMKGMGVMELLALDLLRRDGSPRTRDIIMLAAADEEEGGKFGTGWLLSRHAGELDAEYVWDEGGFGLTGTFGPSPVFTVAVAEKRELWVRLVARGEPGHSGMPHGANAAEILVRALGKVTGLARKWRMTKVPAAMFGAVAPLMPFPASFLLRHASNPLAFRLALPALAANPAIAAMLRDTVSVTVLRAGSKENVIPDMAEATLDVRLLPDSPPEDFLDRLRRALAGTPVDVEVVQYPHEHAASETGTEFYRALSGVLRELVPGCAIAPFLTPGSTDSSFFRGAGAQCYGLFPAVITPAELEGFHGIDERISIDNLRLGTRVIYEVLRKMSA